MKSKQVTNDLDIDLPIAAWLLQDGYYSGADKAPPGELISVTSLMKPVRQQILQRQVPIEDQTVDLADLLASRMGHALHDSIERAWTEGDWQKAMKRLRYPQKVIDRIVINPKPEDVIDDQIPIYLEQRGFRETNGVVLTGQLDFSIDGAYRDVKSTSTFSYTSGSKDEDYVLQGSMYRWIMPDMIWKDTMRIEFLFTDWQKYRTNEPNYPKSRSTHKEYTLMTTKETEEWVDERFNDIRKNARYAKKQDKLIRCTDKELWRGADSWKYYSNPETAKKGGRATKNFDNPADAEIHRQKAGKGVVVHIPGEVKACAYCPAFAVCEQRKEYFPDD